MQQEYDGGEVLVAIIIAIISLMAICAVVELMNG